ncbi:MAG: hypothetical protein J5822_08180, partial [Eubacteriaceae bacterium]|nr:hypothetical protein [Eubacteriaceae bacterium]
GVICLNSQFDEVFSAKKVEEYGREYTGQVVTTHLEMDATTFEIFRFYLCMDGEIFWECDVAYDEPEPMASVILRTAFERPTDHPVTLTVKIDPGTDHERSREVTVPANSEFGYILGSDVSYVTFNDPDCTILANWDNISDFAWYVITDPSDEVVQKYSEAYYDLMLETDPDEYYRQYMAGLVQANQREALLSNHKSAHSAVQFADGTSMDLYLEDGLYYGWYGEYAALVDGQGQWYDVKPDAEEPELLVNFYAMSDEERDAMLAGLTTDSFLDDEATMKEVPVSVEDNGDGTMTLITMLDAEDYDHEGHPEEYQDLPMESVYIIDTSNGEILQATYSLVRGDERIPDSTTIYDYDGPRPERLQQILALREKLTADDSGATWTMTVIYDAGTEAEQRYSITLPEALDAGIVFRDGYEEISAGWSEASPEYTVYAGPAAAKPE